MGSANIAFLGNRGVVVCGERIDYAYDNLYYQQRANFDGRSAICWCFG